MPEWWLWCVWTSVVFILMMKECVMFVWLPIKKKNIYITKPLCRTQSDSWLLPWDEDKNVQHLQITKHIRESHCTMWCLCSIQWYQIQNISKYNILYKSCSLVISLCIIRFTHICSVLDWVLSGALTIRLATFSLWCRAVLITVMWIWTYVSSRILLKNGSFGPLVTLAHH